MGNQEGQIEQNIAQTKKEKILIVSFFTILIAVVAITYIKYFILKDYYIQAEIDCDPKTESCFIYECDPADDEECPENPDERISYYALVMKKASQIPLCDPNDESCDALYCEEGMDCSIIYCNEETKEEGMECNDPAIYNKNNPDSEEDAVGSEEEEDVVGEEIGKENEAEEENAITEGE